MDRLELVIRDSLEDRAHDVEPTPELWREVERHVRRRTRAHRLALAGGAVAAAAAVVTAVVVLPNLLRSEPGRPDIVDQPTSSQSAPVTATATLAPSPTATATVTASEPPAAAAPAQPTSDATAPEPEPDATAARPAPAAGREVPISNLHVSGNDAQLTLTHPETGVVTELVNYAAPEHEGVIAALAVRPGSTTHNLTVVFLHQGEGRYDLRHVDVVDGDIQPWEYFPEQYQVTNAVGAGQGSLPSPVWAPGGDYVAWAETAVDGTTSLRIVGWSGGPGTGDTATDNTQFTIDDDHLAAYEWVWSKVSGDTASGFVRLSLVGADGEDVTFPLSRQPDGAITSP